MNVAQPIYDRVTAVKAEMEAEKQRTVTFDEAVGYLLDFRDQVLGVAADATEAGR